MNRLSLDCDSLETSRHEVDMLREDVKKKHLIIEEKSKIIASLRQQLADLQQDSEEMENDGQILRQKLDRSNKELEEKNQELEAVSHALKEVEAANETLSKRLEGRTSQLRKFVDDLASTKKELDELQNLANQLQHKNEILTIELESANSRKRALRDRERDDDEALAQEIQNLRAQINLLKQQNMSESDRLSKQLSQERNEKIILSENMENLKTLNSQLQQQIERLSTELKSANSRKNSFSSSDRDQTSEEMIQELYDLRAQVKSLSHRQSRRSIDEEILKLKQELDVTETSWRLERQHKERYARENCQLDRKVNEMTKDLSNLRQQYAKLEANYNKLQEQQQQPPTMPPKSNSAPTVQQVHGTAAIHFSVADEVGEIMDSIPVQEKCNHRIQKSRFFENEQKMRIDRANELVRRNMQTKPLHQSSYPLELDTFDPTKISETEMKWGRGTRPALADFSNQRRPIKKAEAFII